MAMSKKAMICISEKYKYMNLQYIQLKVRQHEQFRN